MTRKTMIGTDGQPLFSDQGNQADGALEERSFSECDAGSEQLGQSMQTEINVADLTVKPPQNCHECDMEELDQYSEPKKDLNSVEE